MSFFVCKARTFHTMSSWVAARVIVVFSPKDNMAGTTRPCTAANVRGRLFVSRTVVLPSLTRIIDVCHSSEPFLSSFGMVFCRWASSRPGVPMDDFGVVLATMGKLPEDWLGAAQSRRGSFRLTAARLRCVGSSLRFRVRSRIRLCTRGNQSSLGVVCVPYRC